VSLGWRRADTLATMFTATSYARSAELHKLPAHETLNDNNIRTK
jgi:hypothetical protein